MSKRFICISAASLAATVIWLGMSAQDALAHKEYKEAFVKIYVKADSTDAKDVAFKAAVDKASCGLCHTGKTKKVRNDFGKAVEKFLKDEDKKDPDKVKEGLANAVKEHTKAGDDDSPTFADKIAEGKLPASKK